MKVETEISLEKISGLLCSAFEGGSNYWYTITEFIKPPEVKPFNGSDEIFPHIDYPLNEGGGLMVGDLEDEDREPILLNLESIQNGLTIMANDQPHHFADFIESDGDAITGDVFLQLCLFGEVVYG